MRHVMEAGLFVREFGEGPRGVLWIHGLGESGLCFESLLSRGDLSGFRHVVPDLPGYGRSAWPAEPAPLRTLATQLADWWASRGGEQAVVVGHSMGGVLGVLMAEAHPGMVAGLVNVEGNVSPGDCTASAEAAAMDIEAFLAGGFDGLLRRTYSKGAADGAFRGYFASMRHCDPGSFHLHSRELVRVSGEETMARRMASLGVPVRYVAGHPRGAAPRTLDLLREAEVPCSLVEPSGHWPFIDRPDDFARVLAEALKGAS